MYIFRIKLSNVVIKKTNVSLLADHGLRISANEASGNMAANWHYKENSWFVVSRYVSEVVLREKK